MDAPTQPQPGVQMKKPKPQGGPQASQPAVPQPPPQAPPGFQPLPQSPAEALVQPRSPYPGKNGEPPDKLALIHLLLRQNL